MFVFWSFSCRNFFFLEFSVVKFDENNKKLLKKKKDLIGFYFQCDHEFITVQKEKVSYLLNLLSLLHFCLMSLDHLEIVLVDWLRNEGSISAFICRTVVKS